MCVSMQCKEPHYFSNVQPSQSKKGTDEQMSAKNKFALCNFKDESPIVASKKRRCYKTKPLDNSKKKAAQGGLRSRT